MVCFKDYTNSCVQGLIKTTKNLHSGKQVSRPKLKPITSESELNRYVRSK
jgi:hypothetical protein